MSKFKFFTPLEIRKAKDENGKHVMRLGGIASTIDEDSDGEFLDPSGFEITDFETVGVVNWHHQAKDKPSTIIGEPAVAEIRKDGFYVETDLYPSSETAQEVYELAEVLERDSKTRRLGYSIEGVVLERASDDKTHPDYKIVKKAQITGLAITHMPKNANTFAQIIKGHVDTDINLEEDEEDTEKSLSTESGSALIPESVDGSKNKKDIDNIKLVKSNYNVVQLSEKVMYKRIFDTFSDINIQKAKKIFTFLTKISDVMAKNKVSDTDIQKAMSFFGFEDNDQNPFLEKSDKSEDKSPDEIADEVQDMTYGDDEDDSEEDDKVEKGESKPKDKQNIAKSKDTDPEIDSISKGTVLILKKAIEKAQTNNSIENKALATLVKAQLDQNEILKSKVESLSEVVESQQELIKGQQETISSISTKMERMGRAPRARKSITKGYTEKESFQKAKQSAQSQANVLSMTRNYGQVLEVLDNASMSKGGYDEEFGKAVMSFESSKTLPSNVIARLKTEQGLVIVD